MQPKGTSPESLRLVDRIRAEQVRSLCRNTPPGLAATLLASFLVAVILYRVGTPSRLLFLRDPGRRRGERLSRYGSLPWPSRFGRAGFTRYLSDSQPKTSATFADAPAGVAPFTVTGTLDRDWRDIAGGIDFFGKGGGLLRLSYSHLWATGTSATEYSVKFSIP